MQKFTFTMVEWSQSGDYRFSDTGYSGQKRFVSHCDSETDSVKLSDHTDVTPY